MASLVSWSNFDGDDMEVEDSDVELGLPMIVEEPRSVFMDSIVEHTVRNMRQRGVPLSRGEEMAVVAVLRSFTDCFGKTIRAEAMRVPPVQAQLVHGATPSRKAYPIYDVERHAALQRLVDSLVTAGVLVPAPGNVWASPGIPVKKKTEPGQEQQWRLVFDARGINQVSVAVGDVPLDQKLVLKLAGASQFFAAFDMVMGFFQVPVEPASRELFGMSANGRTFVFTRLPMGWVNAPALLTLSLDLVFDGLPWLIRWIDDFMVCSPTFDGFLDRLRAFLFRCRRFNVILKPPSTILAPVVPYVGLEFLDNKSWRKAPHSFGDARTRTLVTVSDLRSLLGFWGFFTNVLPRLKVLMTPLHDIVHLALASLGKLGRVKGAGRSLLLEDFGWRPQHVELVSTIWAEVDDHVASQTLATPDEDCAVMGIADASDKSCSYVLIQIDRAEALKPHMQRRGRVLFVDCHVFRGAEQNYTTLEKELFAYVLMARNCSHLLMGREVEGCTDHKNLIHLVGNPNSLEKTQSQRRVSRWLIEMAHMRLRLVYVAGITNLYLDYLSRGGESILEEIFETRFVRVWELYDAEPQADREVDIWWVRRAKRLDLSKVENALVDPFSEFEYPSLDLLREYYTGPGAGADAEQAGCVLQEDGVYRDRAGRVFLPEHLRGAAIAAAHRGISKHRGVATTMAHLRAFWWPNMLDAVRCAVRNCLNCAQADPGTVPRELGDVEHGECVGDVLHADYIQFPMSHDGFEYALVIKEDLSQYVWAVPCKDADSATATSVLYKLILKESLLPATLVSDGGSHLAGVLDEAVASLGVRRKVHAAYTPQANGTVERANRDLVESLISVLSSRKLGPTRWTDALDEVVASYNNSPSERLFGHTPHMVFTGRKGLNMSEILTRGPSVFRDAPLNKQELDLVVSGVHATFKEVEARVAAHKKRVREEQHRRHAALTGVQAVTFKVGDLVLVSAVSGKPRKRTKLSPRWLGPAQVAKQINAKVFEVQFLGSSRKETATVERLRFYAGPEAKSVTGLQEAADLSVVGTFNMEELVTLCRDRAKSLPDHGISFMVKWEGYKRPTPNPLFMVYEDAPEWVEAYFAKTHRSKAQRDLVAEAAQLVAQHKLTLG